MVSVLESHPDVRKYLGGVKAPERIRGDFANLLATKEEHYFVVYADGEKAGLVSLGAYHNTGQWEMSYQFLPAFWGKGVARAALTQLLDHAKNLGLDKVYAETQTKNLASTRLLERLGFKEQERLERFGEIQSVYVIRL